MREWEWVEFFRFVCKLKSNTKNAGNMNQFDMIVDGKLNL